MAEASTIINKRLEVELGSLQIEVRYKGAKVILSPVFCLLYSDSCILTPVFFITL